MQITEKEDTFRETTEKDGYIRLILSRGEERPRGSPGGARARSKTPKKLSCFSRRFCCRCRCRRCSSGSEGEFRRQLPPLPPKPPKSLLLLLPPRRPSRALF